jgi:hypothetical protein
MEPARTLRRSKLRYSELKILSLLFTSNGRQDRDVGAAAGGNDDSDRASRHDREPMGFVDPLKIGSD